MDRIVRDTRRVDDVITGVRTMFGNKSAEKSWIEITSLIDEAAALTRRELQEHRTGLQRKVSDDLPPVFANRVQLLQVLVNLILNGIDAMDAVVDRERILTVNVELDADAMTIAIADTGGGVQQDQLVQIFEPFFTTKPEGMGLGLSDLVRSIGGNSRTAASFAASPRVPFGTTFYISLSVGNPAPK